MDLWPEGRGAELLDSDDEISDDEGRADEDHGLQVVVRVGELRFVVSAGSGTQTVRWLSLVTSQRYSAHVQASGKQRQREDTQLEAGNFLPTCVRFNGRKLNPATTLQEVLAKRSKRESKGEELEFEVELCRKVALGEDGGPVLQDWLADAFVHSEAGREHVEELRARERDGDEASSAEEDEDEEDGASQGQLGAPGQHCFFEGPDEVASAFESDWEIIRGTPDYERMFHTAEYNKLDVDKEDEVRSALLEGFEGICSLIDYYAWMWRRPDPLSLSFREVHHLLHHTGTVTLPTDHELVRNAMSVLQVGEDLDAERQVATRAEIILVLLRVVEAQTKPIMFSSVVEDVVHAKLKPAAASLRAADKGAIVRRVFARPNLVRAIRGTRSRYMRLTRALHATYSKFCIGSAARMEVPHMLPREFGLFYTDVLLPYVRSRPAHYSSFSDNNTEPQESKVASQDVVERARQSSNAVSASQGLTMPVTSKPLPELTLTEFAVAILFALHELEKDCDTWDSKYGAQRFLGLLDTLADA